MTYTLPTCGYVACDFAKGVNMNGFDADNDANGAIEIEVCTTAPIEGELNLWYGEFPTRKKLTIVAAGGTMPKGCQTVRLAPEQAICHWTAHPEWSGDCRLANYPCAACGNQCNAQCPIKFPSASSR